MCTKIIRFFRYLQIFNKKNFITKLNITFRKMKCYFLTK